MGKKKGMINAVLLVLVFAATVWMVFRGQNLKAVMGYVQNADVRYWILAVACVFLFTVGEAVNIGYMLHTVGQKVRAIHCLLYAFVGFFFSCITPSSTGGQPMQLYYMRRDKIPTPVASLVLLIVTITYKAVLVAVGILVLILRPAKIIMYLGPVLGLCWLGLFLNTLTVVFLLLLVFHPTLARNMVVCVVSRLGKFRLVRRSERYVLRIDGAMEQYAHVAGYFQAHKSVVWKVFLITIVQRFLLFNVTYLIFRSFGFHGADFLTVILLQGIIAVAVDMLPLPGGMGISEKLFLTIFAPLSGGLTLPLMIVSRGLSFYTQLIMSALMTAVAHLTIARRAKGTEIESGSEEDA